MMLGMLILCAMILMQTTVNYQKFRSFITFCIIFAIIINEPELIRTNSLPIFEKVAGIIKGTDEIKKPQQEDKYNARNNWLVSVYLS